MQQGKNSEEQDLIEQVIVMLRPKIKAALYQTNFNERDDLEQELNLLVLNVLKKKQFKRMPTFFELLDIELENRLALG